MDQKRTLYLANPYGFSPSMNAGPLAVLVDALVLLGAWVWEPFAAVEIDDREAPQWAWRVGQANLHAVGMADGVFAVVNGCPPDEGVMVEIGLAIAWRKPVFLFRDDFRRCCDSEDCPLFLMVFSGCSADGWRSCWYDLVEELQVPNKGLGRWLPGEDVLAFAGRDVQNFDA